jgi:hypothetical protein
MRLTNDNKKAPAETGGDGGWGFHPQDGTAYAALILGLPMQRVGEE